MTRMIAAVRAWIVRVTRGPMQPTRFTDTQKLFSQQDRLRRIYPKPDARWSAK